MGVACRPWYRQPSAVGYSVGGRIGGLPVDDFYCHHTSS